MALRNGRNVVLADRRRARTVSAPVATASETEALELDPELDSALRSLSYVDREALLLVAWEDLTPTQAARSLAINPAAFRVRLLRARRRLRARLNEASTGRAIRAQRQPRHGDDMSNDSIMVRLRRANPVPETPAADDSGLFDRITALPQDAPVSEPRERPTRRQRRGLILVLAAVIAALLASTAFAISRWIGGDLVEPPVTRQEYFDAQKQLVLPPGVVWPKPDVAADDNSVTTRGGGGGRAVLIAMNAWECYWVDAIRRGDDAAGQRAHEELKRLLANNVFEAPAGATEDWVPSPFPTVPFATFAHDGGLDWIREGYDRAAASHPRGSPRAAARTLRTPSQDNERGPAQRGLFDLRVIRRLLPGHNVENGMVAATEIRQVGSDGQEFGQRFLPRAG